jgi:hypothetical protein
VVVNGLKFSPIDYVYRRITGQLQGNVKEYFDDVYIKLSSQPINFVQPEPNLPNSAYTSNQSQTEPSKAIVQPQNISNNKNKSISVERILQIVLGVVVLCLLGGVASWLYSSQISVPASARATQQAAYTQQAANVVATAIQRLYNTSTPTVTPTITPTITNTPTIANTPTYTPTPIQITISDLCNNPENYLGQSLRFNGDVTKVDQIVKDAITYTRVQLLDPFPAESHCVDSNSLSPVILYFSDNDRLNSNTIQVGTVVIVEGIGEGLLTTEMTSGISVNVPILSGTFLALDTTCTIKVMVRTQPSDIYLYLDRNKMSVSSPFAVFENICPGVHTLSALNYLGYLIDEQIINIPQNRAEWTGSYVHISDAPSSGIPQGCFNCP